MTRKELIQALRDRASESSQAALAKWLGISQPYLSDVLNGRRAPGPKILRKMGLKRTEQYL